MCNKNDNYLNLCDVIITNYSANSPPNGLGGTVLLKETLDTLYNDIQHLPMRMDSVFTYSVDGDRAVDLLNSLYIKVGMV